MNQRKPISRRRPAPTKSKAAPVRLTQPPEMKTRKYLYGVEQLDGDAAWQLFEACATGDLAKAKALLARDSRLVNAQYWYQFPLHLAVRAGHAPIVKLLLDHGADAGQSRFTYDSWDKLLLAARERGHRRIESLLARAMKRSFNYHPDFEELRQAILHRSPGRIRSLLRRRPDLARASDALGNNPLHWAVLTRQLSLIDLFVRAGTPINARRADGQTPVLLAANGATDYWYRETRGSAHPSLRNPAVLVGALLAHGADYSISVAAAMGDQERIEQLLKADPALAKRLNPAGSSPLSHAASEGHLHLVRLLLEHGADPNQPETGAPSGAALFNACSANHLEIARLLLAHGADPNAGADSSGCCLTICEVCHGSEARPLQALLRQHGAVTPPYAMTLPELRRAIRRRDPILQHEEFPIAVVDSGNLALLRFYLDSDPTALRRLSFRAFPRSAPMLRELLSRGLAPDQPDWLGRTFLHFAAENADLEVAALLLDAGAGINARDLEYKATPLATVVRTASPSDDPPTASRRLQFVTMLLERGAATNLPGDEPWSTPLAWARKRNLPEIKTLLLRFADRPGPTGRAKGPAPRNTPARH